LGKGKLFEFFGIDKIISAIHHFFESRLANIKEEIREKVAETLTKLFPLFTLIFCFTIFLLFTSLTLAFYFAQLLGSLVYGFGCVTLIYFTLSLILYLVIIKNKQLKEFLLSFVVIKKPKKGTKSNTKLLD